VKAFDHGGVFRGDTIAKWLGAVGGGDSGGVDEVLRAPGDAVKGSSIMARGDFLIRLPGLGEGEVFGEGDNAAQFGIEALEAVEVDVGEALGGELARFDPAGELCDGCERDVGVA
jgi:hypothetical protein